MKSLKLLCIMAIAIMALSSFTEKEKKEALIVKKGSVKINGMKIASDWSLTSFTAALGSADRTRDGYNKTHTYDVKGIVLFESMSGSAPSGTISEFQYYLGEMPANNVTPNGIYPGAITIDKLKLSGSYITFSEVKSKLSKWTQSDSYMEHSYRLAKDGIYIYFQFNDSDTRLLKISIGKDKRAEKK